MKFKRELRPEEIASTDVTRVHLNNAWFDRDAGRLVATDGHMIISVPCDVEPGDVTGPVPTDAIKHARAKSRWSKDGKARVRLGKKLADDGKALHRRTQNVTFPPWQQVFPKFKRGDKGTVTVGVNPAYLVALMRAAGQSKGLVALTFNITPEMLDPIRVAAHYGEKSVEAVVMPGRL